MPLTLFDFVQQVEDVTVQDIPDSIQDSIDDELRQQTSGDENNKNDNDLTNPSDARIVADTVPDLNDRAGFTSIQDAIDGDNPENGAAGSPVDKDGTIFIEPGTYNESVTLGTSGVTLKGPNAGIAGDNNRGDEASINRTSAPGSGGSAVSVTAAGVTVDGFQIESAAQNGISVDQPVSDITIQNNRVTSVAGNTFGSGSGDRATGNGIAFGLPRSTPETTVTGLEVNDNEITSVTTEDLASGEDRTTANGIQVLTRQHDVEGMEITGNVISGLEAGSPGDTGDKRARGIVINVGNEGDTIGAADRFNIANNSISNLTGAGGFSDAAGIALFEAGGAAGDGTDRIGPENFTVTGNQFDNLTNTGKDPAPAIFVGGIQTLGDSHSVTGNTINSGSVIRFAGNQPGFDPATADALNADGNTFTDASANLYYSDATAAADLDAVFNDNDFSQVDVVVGDTAITRPPTNDEVLNVDQGTGFNSIQTAVKNANAGNTIAVGSGTFNESVTIDVDGLTLEAADGASPTVSPSSTNGRTDTITASANGVTIQGLTVEATGGSTPRGIVLNADNTAAVNNNVSHADGVADSSRTGPLIAVAGGDSVTVDGNTATDGPIAYVGGDNNQVVFTNNTVEGDLVDEGFFAFGGTDPDITFTGNDFSAAETGDNADVKFDLSATVNGETDDAAIATSVIDENTGVDDVLGNDEKTRTE